MRALTRLVVLGFLTAVAGQAWAQQVGEQAPDLEMPTAENSERTGSMLDVFKNRVIVLMLWHSTDSTSVELFPMLNDLHEKYRKRGVVIIAVTEEKKEKAESTAKGKQAKFIVGFGFDPGEKWRFPAPAYAYIIDPRGIIAHARFHAGDDLEGKIKEVIDKTKPLGSDEQSVKNRFAKLAEMMQKEQFGRAYTLMRELRLIADDKEAGKQFDGTMKQIKEGVDKWLKQARDDIAAKNYKPACARLAEISIRFIGTEKEAKDLKDDAEREIGKLQGDNETKAIMKKALDNAKGELKNDQAADLETVEQYLDARELYRQVIEESTGTDAAKAAQEAIDRINSDPRIQGDMQKLAAAEQAQRWCDLAERFERVELFDLARKQYERVISEHPDSRAAQKARERLDKLPDKEAAALAMAEKKAADKVDKEAKAKAAKEARDKEDAQKPKDKTKKTDKKKSGDKDKEPEPPKPKPEPDRPRPGGKPGPRP